MLPEFNVNAAASCRRWPSKGKINTRDELFPARRMALGAGLDPPVTSRRRKEIMCRWRVVGTSRPSSRHKFPKWKTRWWVDSHP